MNQKIFAGEITKIVAGLIDISESEIYVRTKNRKVAHGRAMAMYFIRKRAGMTLKQVGEMFGQHYSNVIYNTRAVNKGVIDGDIYYLSLYLKTREVINEKFR